MVVGVVVEIAEYRMGCMTALGTSPMEDLVDRSVRGEARQANAYAGIAGTP